MRPEGIEVYERGRFSAPEIYQAAKHEHDILPSLRYMLDKELGINTGSRVIYYANDDRKNSGYGRIIHKSYDIQKPSAGKILIPEYNGRSLDKILDSDQGLIFIQALLDTKDSRETILSSLRNLYEGSFHVTTLANEYRNEPKERLVVFDYGKIYCSLTYTSDPISLAAIRRI